MKSLNINITNISAFIICYLIRLYCLNSNIVNLLNNILLFRTDINNYTSIIEANFLDYNFTNTDNLHSTSLILNRLLYNIEYNKTVGLFFYTLIDYFIASIIMNFNGYNFNRYYKYKDTNDIKNKHNYSINYYFIIIILLNPISVVSSITFNLSNIYVFFVLLPYSLLNKENLSIFLTVLSLLVCPNYSIMIVFYFLYNEIFKQMLKNKSFSIYKTVANCLIKLFLPILIIFSLFNYYLKYNLFSNYLNYFMMLDTNPNIGLLWGILNETFLRFRDFSIIILVLYQISINFLIFSLMFSIKQKIIESKSIADNKSIIKEDIDTLLLESTEKNTNLYEEDCLIKENIIDISENLDTIYFTMLFANNLICDRYPSENQIVILFCLVGYHFKYIQTLYIKFGVCIIII